MLVKSPDASVSTFLTIGMRRCLRPGSKDIGASPNSSLLAAMDAVAPSITNNRADPLSPVETLKPTHFEI